MAEEDEVKASEEESVNKEKDTSKNGKASDVEFSKIADEDNSKGGKVDTESPLFKENIRLILDVSMDVSVELGRSKRTIEEILTLGEGSVIELDRLAGEPIDLLVNGKVIAKGEVVVIDENFGIRITGIVSQNQRIIDINLL